MVYIYIYNILDAHLLVFECMFLLYLPPAADPLCGFLYMVAGEVAGMAKTYRRTSKCALICILMHISSMFLWNPYHPNHIMTKQACLASAIIVASSFVYLLGTQFES